MKRLLITAIAAPIALACTESMGPSGSHVSLSFATAGAPGTLATSATTSFQQTYAYDVTIEDGQNALVLTQVDLVLREIELERVEVGDCDGDPAGCEDFETGPVLLTLPLDNGTTQSVAIDVEPGTFDEIEFDIHKLTGEDPGDDAILAGDPDLADASIRVTGTFNGQAFVYYGHIDEELEFELSPPLVVDETTTSTNVTIRLDVQTWFRDASGALIDPATANIGGANEGVVKENVKRSIEAFEDDDRDGQAAD